MESIPLHIYLVQKYIFGKCFKINENLISFIFSTKVHVWNMLQDQCKVPTQVWVRDVYFIEQISIKPSIMSTQARCRVAYNHNVMDGK